MKRKLKVYSIEYASSMFRCNTPQITRIYSDKKLKEGQNIVVEHINYGIFIGTIIEDQTKEWENDEEVKNWIDYRYVQDIDLSNYLAKIEREKKKEELKKAMEERFKTIDKEQKFAYYATLDEDFKQLYDEYKNL